MFEYCKSLKKIYIPAGVERIELNCFTNCFSLERLKLPRSIKEINAYAFASCTSLKAISYEGTMEEWHQQVHCGTYAWLRVPVKNIECIDGTTRLRND